MTASTTESGRSIPPDVVLSAVADEHRRAVLRSLNQTDQNVMDVDALADLVAERVRNGEPSDDEHRRRVYIALHHVHLPKLEACGMILHDTETKQVRSATGELGQRLLSVVEPYEHASDFVR
ncbi:DUF7344 domain-containing protein [Halalkalicoccus salilacus]|uniref:DUF7344 domain-containing protein n=1 Tax=Halalkalicoccus TaxID=332246 RepID=UPI002F969CC3